MPTLEAGSRYDNINKSMNSFVSTNIATGLSQTVYYMGQGRLGTLPQRWIEIDMIPGSQVAEVKGMPDSGHAVWTELFLNINTFEQITSGLSQVNIYAMASLVDNIRELFEISASIPVYDYDAVGTPLAGGLMVWASPSIREIPTPQDAGFRQVNISVPLRYHSITSS